MSNSISIISPSSIFEKFAVLMEQNSRGVQIGIYSVAVFGLAVAIRRVRPFTRFKSPSDIPNNFISSRIKLIGKVARIEPIGPFLRADHKPLISLMPWSLIVLTQNSAIIVNSKFTRFKSPSDIPNNFISSRIKLIGKVARIEPNGPFLMVDHKPLISLIPRGLIQSTTEVLPVKIAGVNLTGNGVSWLQTIVANNEISFVPVAKKPHCVDCEVTMDHKPSWQPKSQHLNIGEVLVSLGFGTVAILDPKLSKNEGYLTYYKRLLAAEKQAEKKRMGIWLYNSTSPPWHSRLIGELWNVVQTKFQKT